MLASTSLEVEAALAAYSGVKNRVSNSVFILCPYHSEKTPSGRIFLDNGYFTCYGCGHKAPWSSIKEKLGIGDKPSDIYAGKISIPVEYEEVEKLELKELPKGKSWRGFSTSFLSSLGAKLQVYKGKTWVWFPVEVLGIQRGYIRAFIKKPKTNLPSYFNSYGTWSKEYGLFLFDQSVNIMDKAKKKTLVVVEGPRDALRLVRANIPAVALLGATNFTEKKASLLEIAGVTKIISCLDGDSAGIAGTKNIEHILSRGNGLSLEVFSLSGKDSPYWKFKDFDFPKKEAGKEGVELWDPYSMPKAKLNELKQLYLE